MMIKLIAAVSSNGVIGKDNQLPWHISDDLRRFRKLTTGHTVLMGRRTFDSIGKPLPGRDNIVVSRQDDLCIDGATVCNSIDDGMRVADKDKDLFIIGGSSIYDSTIGLADELLITMVHGSYEGDTYFPCIPAHYAISNAIYQDGPIPHEYVTYVRV